jgi:hypothetical protein
MQTIENMGIVMNDATTDKMKRDGLFVQVSAINAVY